MKSTKFLKLNMPELSDKADILKMSENMEWIDDVIKTLNELHASIEQRLTRLELKDETTDAAIASIRTDVSSLIRGVDGLISRVNALEASQTATANRINTLSDRHTADIAEVTRQIATLESRLTVLVNSHKSDVAAINENITAVNSAVNKLSATVSKIDANEKNLEEKMEMFNTNLNNLTRQTAEINGRVLSHDSSISEVKTGISNANASIKNITDVTENLDARVTALEKGPEPEPVPPTPMFYVYWGASAAETPNMSVVSALPYKIYTDTVLRTITVPCDSQYCYYCIPKSEGSVQFEVSGFTGGFENPIEVSIVNSDDNNVIYNVYRSTQLLNGNAPIKVKR